MNVIVYYRNHNGHFVTFNLITKVIDTVSDLPLNINRFELMKGYETTEADLMAFGIKLSEDREILKNYKVPGSDCKYDVFKSSFKKRDGSIGHIYKRTDNIAINFFKRYSAFTDYNNMFEPISLDEYNIFDKCYNAGIYYGKKGIYNAHSYDFRMFYPSLLAEEKFYFPTKSGQWKEYDELDFRNLKYGIYHCEIKVYGDAKKVFMISKNNMYTHYDLQTAIKLQKRNNDEVEINFLGKAYVYDECDLICGNEVFGQWYNILKKMKNQFPKNIIVKLLSSSLWGYLSSKNVIKRYEHELNDEYDLAIDMDLINENTTHVIIDTCMVKGKGISYTLLPIDKQPMKYNFRLKSFITAYCRKRMIEVLYPLLNKLYRVNTDGFICADEFKDSKRYKTLIYEGYNTYEVENSQKCKVIS